MVGSGVVFMHRAFLWCLVREVRLRSGFFSSCIICSFYGKENKVYLWLSFQLSSLWVVECVLFGVYSVTYYRVKFIIVGKWFCGLFSETKLSKIFVFACMKFWCWIIDNGTVQNFRWYMTLKYRSWNCPKF